MSQNTTKFVRSYYFKFWGTKNYSENHTHPEATVTVVSPITYSSFLNTYCK